MRGALRRGTSPTSARPALRSTRSVTVLRKARGSGRLLARRSAVHVRATPDSGRCGAWKPRRASRGRHMLRLGLGDQMQPGAPFPLPRVWCGRLLGVPLQGVAHHPTWAAGTAAGCVAALPDPPAGHTGPASVGGVGPLAERHGLRVGQDGQEVVPEAEESSTGCPPAICGACGPREGRTRRAWTISCATRGSLVIFDWGRFGTGSEGPCGRNLRHTSRSRGEERRDVAVPPRRPHRRQRRRD